MKNRRHAILLRAGVLAVCLAFGVALAPQAGAAAELQIASRLVVAPGNITITPDGRQIVSLHQFYLPKNRVVEIAKDGSLRPFPNAAYNQPDDNPLGVAFDSVLGLQSDANGVVWLLDNAQRGSTMPKLVAWDTRKDRLVRVIYLPPPATLADSFLNDLAIDLTHSAIYIADTATGDHAALIVVDIATGLARRVLQGHLSVVPEDVDLAIDGKIVEMKKPTGEMTKLRVGVNPIALDGADDWLYFGPMSGTSLYRIRTDDLANPQISRDVLPEHIERYCDKPVCDGIAIDRAGNIYITDIAANAVGVITTDHHYRRLVSDPQLSWPDAFAIGPDGFVYIVANQLQRSPKMNNGQNLAETPFLIFKMPSLARALPTPKPKGGKK
jgi:sugar lactone lactonase YvrE